MKTVEFEMVFRNCISPGGAAVSSPGRKPWVNRFIGIESPGGTTETAMIRYPIRSYENDFFAGRCANGDQVVLGLLCPNVVLYLFDSEGNFIRREMRPWEYPADQRLGGIYQIYESTFRIKLAEQIAAWQSEIGFVEGRIEIGDYFDGEQYVGIDQPEADECAFVFWWAKDYWMDEQGNVEST